MSAERTAVVRGDCPAATILLDWSARKDIRLRPGSGTRRIWGREKAMAKGKGKPYTPAVLALMDETTAVLSKAHALAAIGMPEITGALWEAAAASEERLAPLLEALGREREAAVHRISAASCHRRAGHPGRALNLFRAALAGPLTARTRRDVEQMVAACLEELGGPAPPTGRRGRKPRAEV